MRRLQFRYDDDQDEAAGKVCFRVEESPEKPSCLQFTVFSPREKSFSVDLTLTEVVDLYGYLQRYLFMGGGA